MTTRRIATILSTIAFMFMSFVVVAHAQDYTPLAPLPGTYSGSGDNPTTNFGLYLSGMITLIIAVAGALAVLMIVVGGTQYVASGITPSAKDAAKEKIQNALIGLGLTLASYLILNSINPKLLEFNLLLAPIELATKAPLDVVSETTWGDDYTVRSRLISAGNEKLSVNPGNCAKVGDTGCTSVFGLGETAILGLINLANDCSGCSVVVTGGTEYWRHGNLNANKELNPTKHKPGGNVVDLSLNSTKLNDYIRSKGTSLPDSTACSVGKHYQIGNAMYVDETIAGNAPHWHVCYGTQ